MSISEESGRRRVGSIGNRDQQDVCLRCCCCRCRDAVSWHCYSYMYWVVSAAVSQGRLTAGLLVPVESLDIGLVLVCRCAVGVYRVLGAGCYDQRAYLFASPLNNDDRSVGHHPASSAQGDHLDQRRSSPLCCLLVCFPRRALR